MPDKLGPRPDPELCVDMGEMARHRPLTEEERRGDLAVGAPLGDELGDAQL